MCSLHIPKGTLSSTPGTQEILIASAFCKAPSPTALLTALRALLEHYQALKWDFSPAVSHLSGAHCIISLCFQPHQLAFGLPVLGHEH